jgi:FKBP-type peptidyl-prolyl cis-trans isomerase FklB
MNIKTILLVGCTLLTTAPALVMADAKPSSDKEKFSYAVGFQVAQSLKQQGANIDLKTFSQAINDVMSGAKLKLSMQEMQSAVENYQKQQMAERASKGEEAKKAGEKFLAENKKKKGVVTTDSGLQYEVIKKGNGKKPAPTDTVVANYRGTLIDGTVFDSSYKRGEPATFGVNKVIPGWQEVLQLMPVGSKYKVFIPSELAYGARGAGATIGPNETLIFEIELLKIK